MAQEMQYVGEYHLHEAEIIPPSGDSIQVTNTAIEFSIYEDIFVSGLYGDITIVDTDSLTEIVPIIGQEQLVLHITTPGLEDSPIRHNFSIYAIARREDLSKGGQVLKLLFCSPEVLQNERIRISKSYTNTIDNIVADVLMNNCKTRKQLYTERTSGVRKLIAPNLHPHSLINSLTTEAVSSRFGANHFVFYENLYGINFHSLEYLFSEPIVQEIKSDGMDDAAGPRDTPHSNPIFDYMNPIEFQINTNNHLIGNIKSGMLGSKMTEYNMFRKNYKEYTYRYFDEFYKTPRLNSLQEGSHPIYSDGAWSDTGQTISQYPDSKIHLSSISSTFDDNLRIDTTNSTGAYDDVYTYASDGLTNVLSRQSKLTELIAGLSVTMKIHGHTGISVGKVIHITMPPSKNDSDAQQDKYLSGNFLITKARHIFNNSTLKHEILINAAADGFNTRLPNSRAGSKEYADVLANQTGPIRTIVSP